MQKQNGSVLKTKSNTLVMLPQAFTANRSDCSGVYGQGGDKHSHF